MSLSFDYLQSYLYVYQRDIEDFTDPAQTTSKMKHLAAYLLLGLAGNSEPSESDVKGVLESVGIDADDDRLSKLLEELKGKDINEVGQSTALRIRIWR